MIVDFMHSCLLGVIRLYTEILLTETGRQKKKDKENGDSNDKVNEFYIGSPSKIDLIDQRLMSMKPTTSCAKPQKSIKESHTWKASDWLNWLLFYSLPCLKGILAVKYLDNLALFVAAMHIFLEDSINPSMVQYGRTLLVKFVCGFQDLYGKNFMNYNIHLLLHLADAVENWGPLWSANTFPFETQNNLLLKMKKCNYRVAQQIVNRHLLHRQINVLHKEESISNKVLEFSKSLVSKREIKKATRLMNCILIGPEKPYTLTENELNSLRAFTDFQVIGKICTYNRLIYDNCRYTTAKYSKNKKNNDSIIKTADDNYCIISNICSIECDNVPSVLIFVYELILNDEYIISTKDVEINHLKPCSLGKLNVIVPNMISQPCVMIRLREHFFVSPLSKGMSGRSIN